MQIENEHMSDAALNYKQCNQEDMATALKNSSNHTEMENKDFGSECINKCKTFRGKSTNLHFHNKSFVLLSLLYTLQRCKIVQSQ